MKRVISGLMALFVAASMGLTLCAPIARAGDLPPIPLRRPGDANNDGKVDSRDVIAVARYLAGGWQVTINDSNADVNGDRKVNLKDVVTLQRYLVGGWDVTLR